MQVQETIFLILTFIIGVILLLFVDYFWLSKKLRELNQKISQDINYLKDKNTRELCKIILNQTFMWRIFTFIEARKLKKSLNV